MHVVSSAGRMWAEEEFGSADLGHKARVTRLLCMASRTAERPSGKITSTFEVSAEREGAYRFLENDEIKAEEVAKAAHRATAARSVGLPFVFVAEDGSSLNITDDARVRGTGPVGARSIGARGFQVMNAIAICPDGIPLGVCGQTFWARPDEAPEKHANRRKTEDKETQRWLDVMDETTAAYKGTGVVPWFQLDRGADCWPVLKKAHVEGLWITVRSAHDRRLYEESGGMELRGTTLADQKKGRRYLREAANEGSALGYFRLDVSAAHGRCERTAKMRLSATPVVLQMSNHQTKTKHKVPVWVVHAVECETTPEGEKPLEWVLLTTRPVADAADAALVVFGYSQRWRVEEFHKAWKSSACNVEETQLRSANGIYIWASILASVAMRLLRLTYLPRRKPHLLATEELSELEIEAVYLLAKKRRPRRGPTLAEVALLIACLGGYTGKSSGGPPGTLVIARGLERVEPVASALRFMREEAD